VLLATDVGGGNLEDALRIEAETREPGYQRQEKALVFGIERDVDEDVGTTEWSRGRYGLPAAL
jgi:hypothetical protein